jgi:D-alanine-D-alanine ligase
MIFKRRIVNALRFFFFRRPIGFEPSIYPRHSSTRTRQSTQNVRVQCACFEFPETFLRIVVLFGGDSMERDVSVASASQVVGALRSRGHEVISVDSGHGRLSAAEEQRMFAGRIDRLPPKQSAVAHLPTLVSAPDLVDVDLVFVALHGGSGENGTVQAVLDLAGIPYTGSGRLGSAVGWDKDVAKRLFLAAGVPTPDWLMAPQAAEAVEHRIGFPTIVKPNGQGSTVGLTLVKDKKGLDDAVALASSFDSDVMIERYVPGRELTVGILEDRALAVGEIIPKTGPIFDYAAKYQVGGAEEIFPAALTPEQTARAQDLALRVHRALKLDVYSRVDFRMDPDGGLWCLEVNTLPGLTSGSLLPRAAAAVGISFPELCEKICRAALSRDRKRVR